MSHDQVDQIPTDQHSPELKCCVADKHDNWCSDVDQKLYVRHEKQTYCLFHAPSESEEKQLMWDNNRHVFALIDQAKADEKVCNLSGTNFPIGIWFEQYITEKELPPINFLHSEFNGYAGFSKTTFSEETNFSHTTFRKEANFSDTIFRGDTEFLCSTFIDEADFSEAAFDGGGNFFKVKFGEDVRFSQATFGGDANFYLTKFIKGAIFFTAHFSGDANFRRATFRGDVNLVHAMFGGGSTFYGVTFSGYAAFPLATFKGNVDFSDTTFSKGPDFFNAIFIGHLMFTNASFEQSFYFKPKVLSKSSFGFCKPHENIEFHQADLRKMPLLNTPINKFRFVSCQWPKSHGRNTVYDARRVNDQGYFELTNTKTPEPHEGDNPPNPGVLEDLFQQLKKNAKADNNEMLVSDWHYGEKEMQRLKLQKEIEADSWVDSWTKAWGQMTGRSFLENDQRQWWRSFFLYQMITAYKKFSGYSEEPLRGFLWLVGFLLLPILMQIPESILVYIPFLPSWELFPGDATYYIPLTKQKASLIDHWLITRLYMTFWQVMISVQAALFGFALRNRLRR